jgi:hypothetical protein
VFKSGATSSEIKLGNRSKEANILIQSGASEYVISIPGEMGYKVSTKSGLSSVSVPTGRASVIGDDSKTSENYESATSRVNIALESGLTSLVLKTY